MYFESISHVGRERWLAPLFHLIHFHASEVARTGDETKQCRDGLWCCFYWHHWCACASPRSLLFGSFVVSALVSKKPGNCWRGIPWQQSGMKFFMEWPATQMQMTYSIRYFHLENERIPCPLYLKEILPWWAITENEVSEVWSQDLSLWSELVVKQLWWHLQLTFKSSGHISVMVRDASL